MLQPVNRAGEDLDEIPDCLTEELTLVADIRPVPVNGQRTGGVTHQLNARTGYRVNRAAGDVVAVRVVDEARRDDVLVDGGEHQIRPNHATVQVRLNLVEHERDPAVTRSEEHTSELHSLMLIS